MYVRNEEPRDFSAIREVNRAAFGTDVEANIVDALRLSAQSLVSLVASQDEKIVGHIMFSPVSLGEHFELNLLGLAPMAVLPAYQRRGVGSALVHAGLERCRQHAVGAIVVLGHPGYYPRFGFQPSVRFCINSEYDVPPEAFMVLELQPGYLRGASGTIKFNAAFRDA